MGETYKKLLFQRYGISGSLYNTFVIVTHRFLLQIGEFFLNPNIFLRLFSKLVNNFISSLWNGVTEFVDVDLFWYKNKKGFLDITFL